MPGLPNKRLLSNVVKIYCIRPPSVVYASCLIDVPYENYPKIVGISKKDSLCTAAPPLKKKSDFFEGRGGCTQATKRTKIIQFIQCLA